VIIQSIYELDITPEFMSEVAYKTSERLQTPASEEILTWLSYIPATYRFLNGFSCWSFGEASS
jgi:hypothetical protein